MGLLLTCVPWLTFWILASCHKLFLAIFVALAASVATIIIEKMSGRSVKVLQSGTLAVFVILGLTMVFVDHAWLGRWIRILSNAGLTLIVLVSIIIRKPFTLQYARESVPKESWDSPEFLHANYIITWVWFAAFVVNTAASGLDHIIPSMNAVVGYAIASSPFVVATMFTTWYRKKSR